MANFSTALRRLLCVGALALCTAFSSVPTPRITDWQSFRAAVIEEVQHANSSFPANVTGKQVEEVALRMWTFINTDLTSTNPDLASLAKLLEYLARKITAFYGDEAWEYVESSCGLRKDECRTLVIDQENTCFLRQLCVLASAKYFAVLTHFPCGLACPVGSKLPDGNQRFLVRADTEEDCNLLSRWYGCGTSCEQVAGSGDDSVYVRGLLDGLGGGFQQKFFTTCPESTACNGCPDLSNAGGPNGEYSRIQFQPKENCPWLSQCESPNKATCSLTVYRNDNDGDRGCKSSESETKTVKVGESGDNDNLRTFLDNDVTSVSMEVSDSTMKCEVTLFKGNRRNNNDGDCYWKLTAPVNDFQVRNWYSKSFTGSDNKDSASAYHLQYDLGEYDSGQNKCGRIGYESPNCYEVVLRDLYTNYCPTDSWCVLQDKYTCTAEPWCSTGSQYFNAYL